MNPLHSRRHPPRSPRPARGAALLPALLAAGVLAWAALLGAALWVDSAAAERDAWAALLAPRRGLVLLFALALPALLALVLTPWLRGWPRAARRLRDEVDIVAGAHATHALTIGGAREMRELAAAVQRLADAHAALGRDVQARIGQAQQRLADETRRLAALMSELPQAVLVASADGTLVLYNAAAAALFGHADDGMPLGLGRPLAALFHAGAIDHARQLAMRRLQQGGAASAQIVTRRGGTLLRVQVVPIGSDGDGGLVLIADDVTRRSDALAARDALLQRLTEGSRAALANLRAAAQTLLQHPNLDAERRQRFTRIVADEAERLVAQLGEALRDDATRQRSAWPLEEVQLGDLLFALQRELGDALRVEAGDAALAAGWVEADSHAIATLLAHLQRRIAADGGEAIALHAEGDVQAPRLVLSWSGAAPGVAWLAEREAERLATAAGAPTLREVLDQHGAELWTAAGAGGQQRLCLQFAAGAAGSAAVRRAPPRGRPVAYDFDLFHQPGQNAALDATPLAALSCTVFDTETTGLDPSGGDEIIAIGAVRIVNARLLDGECFERLTRPRRPVRASAEAVHGISSERLAGEPPLETVLPAFAAFCSGTVLVAHNAAFDLRFLELARERCGVRFDQPVLDTLLLSEVAMPGHGLAEHHLEQIAARLGVAVSGRHQALGDALLTARVFLKLLPLLAERGITTLGQARDASQRTLQARVSY